MNKVKKFGEVFTPPALVNEILDKLSEYNTIAFIDASKTMLDPACGDGNFLVAILDRRLANGIPHLEALKTLYGVEIQPDNVMHCKMRLSLRCHNMGPGDLEIWKILDRNIICADSLDRNHIGWRDVGYMWEK